MLTHLPDIDGIVALITRASTELPYDVVDALDAGLAASEGNAACVTGQIIANSRLARANGVPMCQDTGIPSFWVSGVRLDSNAREAAVWLFAEAVRRCVATGVLRPNAVDALSGRNSGDGVGAGIPQVHFQDESGAGGESGGGGGGGSPAIAVMLKGGGCENVGRQYSLPDASIGAGRDLDGVRRCVVDAAFQAQGLGCAPGILGVCVGGDRASGHLHAKMQLLRRLDERDSPFRAFEAELVSEVNSLGIGPMGLGGTPTVLAVKVGTLSRHPASFFVTIAYGCWALRRHRIEMDADGSWVQV